MGDLDGPEVPGAGACQGAPGWSTVRVLLRRVSRLAAHASCACAGALSRRIPGAGACPRPRLEHAGGCRVPAAACGYVSICREAPAPARERRPCLSCACGPAYSDLPLQAGPASRASHGPRLGEALVGSMAAISFVYQRCKLLAAARRRGGPRRLWVRDSGALEALARVPADSALSGSGRLSGASVSPFPVATQAGP